MSRTSRSAPRPSPPRPTPTLSHIDARGEARMVDVTAKGVTAREAVARGRIRIAAPALRLVRAGQVKKGDPLQVARLAGIMAAKQTASLIPLCHPLPLSGVEVVLVPRRDGYEIRATVRTTAQTGVEMEALTAVSVTALTLYDMIKAVDKTMTISDIALVSKRGGASGDYVARANRVARANGDARSSGGARSNGRTPAPRRPPPRVRPPARVRR